MSSAPHDQRPPRAGVFLDRHSPPALVTLICMAAVAALAMNIFLPALPDMAKWFGVPYGAMQQSVTLYLALSALVQLMVGPLADRFGRRPVMLAALVLFVVATIGTLIAPSIGTFLFCRMAQAVIATGLVLSRAVIRDTVARPEEAATRIAWVTMAMSMAPMAGPVIGGSLNLHFGWQSTFWVQLAMGVVVTGLVWADLGETLAAPQNSLLRQFRQYPALLASRRYWGYCLSATFVSGAFFAYLGGAPYVGTQVFGLASDEVGFMFALTALGYAFGNFLAGRFSGRIGMNRMVLAGCLTLCAGLGLLLLLTLMGVTGPLIFFGCTATMGIGNGMAVPNANAGMLSVRPDLAGSASGLGGAIMIGGGAGLAAIAGLLLPPGASEMPLILLMLACGLASVAAILFVMARARRSGAPS